MIVNLLASLKDFANQGQLSKAFKTFSLIQVHATSSFCSDYVLHSASSLLLCCTKLKSLELGKQLHGHVIPLGLERHPLLVPKLVTFYSTFDLLVDARFVVENSDIVHPLPWNLLINSYVRNELFAEAVYAWNSLLSGYAHMDRSEEASFSFREMLRSGIEPNYVTIASILPLCARVANLQHGKEFHCYIIRREIFKDYLLLYNALVEMYARSGKIREAKTLFDLMSRRDEVTYTSLIAGYGMQGEGKTALKLFEEMNKFHIKPDHVTMVAVLSACSHSGLIVDGQLLFKNMHAVYGIIPRLEHYACMVDLYGRAGLLNKAKETITKMPFVATPAMWATLLGACRIHGNTDVGEWTAEKLLEMRPERSGYYVLIANMYAAAGCWNKLAEVRTLMRDMGVRKAPGCTWIDVGTEYCRFVVDDTLNPQSQEVYPLLDGLTELMKDVGYVATEDFCSEDEVVEGMG